MDLLAYWPRSQLRVGGRGRRRHFIVLLASHLHSGETLWGVFNGKTGSKDKVLCKVHKAPGDQERAFPRSMIAAGHVGLGLVARHIMFQCGLHSSYSYPTREQLCQLQGYHVRRRLRPDMDRLLETSQFLHSKLQVPCRLQYSICIRKYLTSFPSGSGCVLSYKRPVGDIIRLSEYKSKCQLTYREL